MAKFIKCFVDRLAATDDFHVYLHPSKMAALSLTDNSYIHIISQAGREVLACVCSMKHSGPVSSIQMNRCFRINLNVYLGQVVAIASTQRPPSAEEIGLVPVHETVSGIHDDLNNVISNISADLRFMAVSPGFIFPVYQLNRIIEFKVISCTPADYVVVGSTRALRVHSKKKCARDPQSFSEVSYDDVGGLSGQIEFLRFFVELPLLQPQIFESFGVHISKGLVLCGPSGCGKSFLAKAMNNESPVAFERICGYDLRTKTSEEASGILMKLTERALAKAPSIVFFDDADQVLCDQPIEDDGVEIDRRLSYAMVAAVDKLLSRSNIVVIAAVRDAAMIPSHFRNVNRLAHQIEIPMPSAEQRLDILKVMTRCMKVRDEALEVLAEDASLTGADLRFHIDKEIINRLAETLAKRTAKSSRFSVEELRSFTIDNLARFDGANNAGFRRSGPFRVPVIKPEAESNLTGIAGDQHGENVDLFAVRRPEEEGSHRRKPRR
jgi:transitional endoplasmic reticulum ATPase